MTDFPIEALLDIEQPSEATLSPDGAYVAYVLGKWHKPDKDTAPPKNIQLIEVATGKQRPLTNSVGSNDLPCWSPDSRQLAFVSNRSDHEEMQLYLIDVQGGEAQALTDLRGCVDVPKWSPDGRTIAFLYSGTLDKAKRPDPDPIVVDAEPLFNRVWLIDPQTHDLRAVTPETCHVFEYAWSPDSRQLVVLTSPHPNPAEGWYSAQLHRVDISTGEVQQLCTLPYQIGRLTWSPDGTKIAFVHGVMSDEGNVSGDVYVVPATGGEAHCLTPDIGYSVTWIEWREEAILFGGRHIETAVLGEIDPDSGEERLISKGMYAINGVGAQKVAVSRNHTFAAQRASFDEPPNVYLGSLKSGEWKGLTQLPLDTELFPPLRVENKHWHGPNGNPVHGFLVYPPDYTPGKRYPMVAHVHGGPSWSYVPTYMAHWERLFTSRGCLVLMPNPRGSWGRGHAYQSANVGDLGGGDWQDINAGIDCMIDEGLADPEHLAVGGWSYGGYLTTWAVTQTDRFRCAIAGASITNYESNYGVVSNREWQTTMFGSNVYEDTERHRSRSPMTYVSRVKTPTLLVHGKEDTVAPPEQSIEFYTALRYFGVPTQLVLYPREPHGFRERAHVIDLYQRILAWIDTYLFD
jgi:dipeptidyl aminopeptidase/acylaminoacyl peptidase